jgi:hypothetical protein
VQQKLSRSHLFVGLLSAMAVAVPAHAQASASSSLSIVAQLVCPLSVSVTHPLDFGRLLTSTARTVAPADAASGQFQLIGQGGSTVTVALSMPSELSPTGGGPNLPITGWSYVVSNTPALGGTPVSFRAGASDPISLRFDSVAGSSKLYFGIGATVTASASHGTVAYTATGQITAAYTDL